MTRLLLLVLPLALGQGSAGSTMDRRRAAAKEASAERRRSEMRELIGKFQQEPWGAPQWAKQDTIAADLERTQQDSFDEVLQQNQEVKSDLLLAVQDQSDFFADAERQFSEGILMVKTERVQIQNSLKVADSFFGSETEKMKGWITQLTKMDNAYYKLLQDRWKNVHKEYVADAESFFKKLTGAKYPGDPEKYRNDVAKMAKAFTASAKKEADKLGAKYKKAADEACGQNGKLKSAHDSHKGSVKGKLTNTQTAAEGILSENEELKASIDTFGAGAAEDPSSMKGQLEELKLEQEKAWNADESADEGNYAKAKEYRAEKTELVEDAGKADGAGAGDYNVQAMAKEFGDEDSSSKGKLYKDDVSTDVKSIEDKTKAVEEETTAFTDKVDAFESSNDGTTQILGSNGQASEVGVKLLEAKVAKLTGDEASPSEPNLESETQKLQQFAEGMKEFPRDAKDDIRTAETAVIEKLGEVNDQFYKQIDNNVNAIQAKKTLEESEAEEAVAAAVKTVKESLNEKYDTLVKTSPTKGAYPPNSIQAAVQPEVDTIQREADKLEELVGGIAEGKMTQNTLKANTAWLDKTLKMQIDTVDKRMDVNLKKAEQKNTGEASTALDRLKRLEEKVTDQSDRGVKEVNKAGVDAQREIETEADRNMLNIKTLMTNAKAAATKSVQAHQETTKLAGEIKDYGVKTGVLETAVKKVADEFTAFSTKATSESAALESTGNEALNKAVAEAQTHVDALSTAGSEEVARMGTAIDKLTKTAEKKATQMQDDLTHRANLAATEKLEVQTELEQDVNDVGVLAAKVADPGTGEVDTAKKTVDAANTEANKAATAAFEQATKTLESYKRQFDGADTGSLPVFQAKAERMIGENGLRGTATTLADQADADILKAAQQAAAKVAKSEQAMQTKVAAMSQDLAVKAVDVDARKQQLHDLGVEAEAQRQLNDKTAAGVDELGHDIDDAKAAIGDARTAGDGAIADGASAVETGANGQIANAQSSLERSLHKAEGTADDEMHTTEASLEHMTEAEKEALLQEKAQGEAEAADAAGKVGELEKETRDAKVLEERRDRAMASAFEDIAQEAADQENQFKAQLSKSKSALQALQEGGSEHMDALVQEIEGLEEDVKKGVKKITGEDKKRVAVLKNTADKTKDDITSQTEDTRAEVEAFSSKLGKLSEDASKALEEASHMEEGFQDEMNSKQRAFQDTLMGAKKARINATQHYHHDVDTSIGSMDATLSQMKTLASKVTGQIKYELGSLQLDQAKLDRQLDHTLSLEKYGDEGAIALLSKKLEQAVANENTLDEMKDRLQNKSEAFRARVQADFKALNIDFDMSAVDVAAAQAHEQYYIQQQEQRLKAELGETLGDLSGLSEARLAALAKASGAKIAELMRNTELSEEERAAALQKIRADARAHAQTILEANGRLQLEQETAARSLKVATDDVDNSMQRISGLGSVSAVTGQAGLDSAIGRIKDLLEQANKNIGDAPPPEEDKAEETAETAAAQSDVVEMRTQAQSPSALQQEGAELLGDAPGTLPGEPGHEAGPVHGVLNSIMAAINPSYFKHASLIEKHGSADSAAAKLKLTPTDAVPIVMEAERGTAKAMREDDALGDRLAALERKLITN